MTANGGWGGNGGTITIDGGNATATDGDGGAGIGGGYGGGGGAISTGTNGSAFIMASSISNKESETSWSGLIFDGNNGHVYSSQTIVKNFEVKNGQTLTIPAGTTLTIPSGVTLINNGTIINYGTISGNVSGNTVMQGYTIT